MAFLLLLLTGAAAQVNEVALAAEVAQMTGDLMVKQKQFSTAELKVKQLATQEVSFSKQAERLEREEAKMEEALSQGQLSKRSVAAQAAAQKLQRQLVASEAQVEELRKAIKSESGMLRSAQAQLERMKRKEDSYSHGARLAVMKSNKLERELKDARRELEAERKNLTGLREAAEVDEAQLVSARRLLERQQAENGARAQWLAARRPPVDLAGAEAELAAAKRLLMDGRRRSEAEAAAEAQRLARQRRGFEQLEASNEEAIQEAQAQLLAGRKEQQRALEAASHRQGSVVARRSSAQALKALSSKLLDEKAQLQQQQVENEAKAKEIAAEHVKWDAEKKKQEDMVRSESRREEQELKTIKADAQEQWAQDRRSESQMERSLQKLRTDQQHEQQKQREADQKLRRAQKRLKEAQSKLQSVEEKERQQELEYEEKMYEANLKREEGAQAEVHRLEQEFHELHEGKSAKITSLSHQLEDLRNAKLRGA